MKVPDAGAGCCDVKLGGGAAASWCHHPLCLQRTSDAPGEGDPGPDRAEWL